jgi:hypothetical protein
MRFRAAPGAAGNAPPAGGILWRMQGNSRRRRARTRAGAAAALGALAALLAWSAPAASTATPSFAGEGAAAAPAPQPPARQPSRAELERWRGRFCTPAGCPGGREASPAMGAGFAAAALAVVLAARRSRPRG